MYDSLSRQVADSLEAGTLPGIGDTRRQPQIMELLSRIGRHLFDVDLCLIMRASDKHWISEIGEMLGWGESKVKVRLHRARKKMAERCEKLLGKGVKP